MTSRCSLDKLEKYGVCQGCVGCARLPRAVCLLRIRLFLVHKLWLSILLVAGLGEK